MQEASGSPSLPSRHGFLLSYPFKEAASPDAQEVRELLSTTMAPDVRLSYLLLPHLLVFIVCLRFTKLLKR